MGLGPPNRCGDWTRANRRRLPTGDPLRPPWPWWEVRPHPGTAAPEAQGLGTFRFPRGGCAKMAAPRRPAPCVYGTVGFLGSE